jgi:hypothetical protein
MIKTIETTVNGTPATYFVSDSADKPARKEIQKLAANFRFSRPWFFESRVEPASRDEFIADFPATAAALEAASVDINKAAVIYEAHD